MNWMTRYIGQNAEYHVKICNTIITISFTRLTLLFWDSSYFSFQTFNQNKSVFLCNEGKDIHQTAVKYFGVFVNSLEVNDLQLFLILLEHTKD